MEKARQSAQVIDKIWKLSFRGAQRRGIRCLPAIEKKRISRYARNDIRRGFASTLKARQMGVSTDA